MCVYPRGTCLNPLFIAPRLNRVPHVSLLKHGFRKAQHPQALCVPPNPVNCATTHSVHRVISSSVSVLSFD